MDCLAQLQCKSKWTEKLENPSSGDVVLVRTKGNSPSDWPLNRIIQFYPDKKGDIIRLVDIKFLNVVKTSVK